MMKILTLLLLLSAALWARGESLEGDSTAIGYTLCAITRMPEAERPAAVEAWVAQFANPLDALLEGEDSLYDPEGPFYNESLMLAVAHAVTHSPLAAGETKERADCLAAEIEHNAPGTVAPDFVIESADGLRTSLAQIAAAEGPVMLLFYDPECDVCHRVTGSFDVRAMGLRGVAVNMAPGTEERHPLPQGWMPVTTPEEIDLDGRYDIRTTPTIFILERDMTVRAKNWRPGR